MTASWIFPAPSAAPRTRRGATGVQACFQSKRRADISGSVTPTDQTLNCAGLAQAETRQVYQERLLLARREALANTAKHLRNQMRCSEASNCEAELRAVTNTILAQGGR